MNTKSINKSYSRETYTVRCGGAFLHHFVSRSLAYAEAQRLANLHGEEATVTVLVDGKSTMSPRFVEPKK